MERLELVMPHCRLYHSRQLRWVVDPIKQTFDANSKLIARRRRNEARIVEAAPWRSDDHDTIAESASVT